MVFSSLTFLVYFLPIFLIIYNLLPKSVNLKNIFILISSILFYSWGGPKFIFVILGVTLLDFLLVSQIEKFRDIKNKKRLFLILSVSLNLGLLFYFKYFNFFIDNLNAVGGLLGSNTIHVAKILLPIGISFYTFESITYSVDVYRNVHKPLSNFWEYQLYIIFFPKLIAGPIVRYHDMSDQITGHVANENAHDKLQGFIQFCIGLGKKVLIANVMGSQADAIMNMDAATINTTAAWIGAIAYTFQIYFDFSGYSDMAIGISRTMGFKLPENFNNPYTATSITDFWRRWHITLGAWMRNYLYIPLGGNRVSNSRLYLNLAIVFIASGLWHGASWNFILWGAFHGLFLILDRIFLLNILNKIGRIPSIIITFFIVVVGWVIFRIEDIHKLKVYLQRMFAFDFDAQTSIVTKTDFNIIVWVAVFFSFFTLIPKVKPLHDGIFYAKLNKTQVFAFSAISVVLYFFCITYVAGSSFNPFIYFRF
jgi:alginate O-acetyltransferase complex protein AlgI